MCIRDRLKALLKGTSISNYSIFLDAETNDLIGVLEIEELDSLEELPGNPIMKKWWAYMKDIMATNQDHSPVSIPLKELFYLP